MRRRLAAALLLVVQLALVLSIAGKYLYERRTRPRIWARTAQFDPNAPLRGRYLALHLGIDACGLPHDKEHYTQGYQDFNSGKRGPGTYRWSVSLGVRDGHLLPVLEDHARSPEGILSLTQAENRGCERVPLSEETEFFIPDTAKTPFPLKKGEELWVEVTAPKSGPPRPIQLALSDSSGFHPLRFE
jgi:hypothetical protein